LYSFGSGAIRGFATTLIIGIFTSLFSAIVLTRLVFFSRLENKKPISFYTDMTKDWFTKINVNFIGNRMKFYILSGIIVVGGIASLATKGCSMALNSPEVRRLMSHLMRLLMCNKSENHWLWPFTEEGKTGNPIVQTKDSDAKVRIMTNYMIDNQDENQDELIQAALAQGLSV